MTIAGFAVGATKGFVYTRSEYPHAIATFDAALAIAPRLASGAGSASDFDIEQRVGAGAYVCGEETSLLDSLEGKRGQVRAKPPLPAHKGLFGMPTVINNVVIAGQRADHPGPTARSSIARSASAARVARCRSSLPATSRYGGLFECGFGVTLGELVNDIGGGTLIGPAGARGAGRRSARRVFPAGAVRYAVRLRGVRRARRADRPWRHRGVRRYGGHGAARRGSRWSSVPTNPAASARRAASARCAAWRSIDRIVAGESGRCEPRTAARSLPHDEVRLVVRAGRVHPYPVMSALDHFPEDFRPVRREAAMTRQPSLADRELR